jgi:hypothetical protein
VFPRYGVHPGASPPVCFAAPPLDVCGFAAWRCAPNPRMDTFARPAEGAEDQKPHQEPKPKPKPKQIKRSQPSAVPTGDWVYSVLRFGRLSGRLREQARSHSWMSAFSRDRSARRPPSPAGWLLQKSKSRAHAFPPLNTMSVSSSKAFDLRARRQAEWRDLSGGGSAATVWRSQTQREEVQRSKP